MGYSFIHRGGHIEVVDAMGRFVLSADTIAEREHIWKRLS